MAGDQRHIMIQVTKVDNKRKQRRGSKKRKQATKPLEERVFHILSTSKLLDYTHPSEVDTYWDKLYRQYETIIYLEAYYRKALANCNIQLGSKELLQIQLDLDYFIRLKKMYLRYMLNAFYIQYGSVMSKKFYGWLRHMKRFTARFTDEALKSITTLKFDVDRTRCSVYFYQIFWLTGLVVKNEITNELNQLTFDDTLSLDNKKYYSAEAKMNNSQLYNEHTYNFSTEDSDLREVKIREFMKQLLEQLGLGIGVITNLNNAGFNALSSHIRKAIKEGKVNLTREQINMLKEVGINFSPTLKRKFLT